MICYKQKCHECEAVNVKFFSNYDGRTRCLDCNSKRIKASVDKALTNKRISGRYSRN